MCHRWVLLLVGLLIAACAVPSVGAVPLTTLLEPTVEITALTSISSAPTLTPSFEPTPSDSSMTSFEPNVSPTLEQLPSPTPKPQPFAEAMSGFNSITEQELESIVYRIAGKDIKTRWCGTSGNRSAGKYIAQYFQEAGIQQFGNSYLQEFSYEDQTCRNIAGFIKGTDEKDLGYVLVIAHYDSVRAGPGADDNASGTAAVIEIAEAFGLLAKEGVHPRRTIVFVLFDAEEAYLKGSQYFVSHPLVELDKVYAVVNMDMIGRNSANNIYYYGVPSYNEFEERRPGLWRMMKAANEFVDLKLIRPSSSSMSFWRTDHWPFYASGVHRVLLLNSGKHAQYHTSGDTPDKLNYTKVHKVARLAFLTVWQLAGGIKKAL